MIRRLRRKFVIINMLIVTIILLAVFFAVLSATQQGFLRESHVLLSRVILSEEHAGPGSNRFQPGKSQPLSMPYLVLKAASDGKISVISDKYFAIESEEELSALAAAALEAPDDYGLVRAYRMRFLRQETPDGTLIAFADNSMNMAVMQRLIISSLAIGGTTLLLFLVISIVLARWAVRPVEQAWSRQRQFVADASHELKTPLTVILSGADLLLSDEKAPVSDTRRWAENIKSEAQRMKRLVEELLTLARTDNPENAPVLSRIDLSDAILRSVLQFEPVIYESGRRLEYDIDSDLFVLGNADQLKQLTDILLDNAVKYADPGGVIRISLHPAAKKKLQLSLQTPGPPIPADHLDAIFERFYRLDSARSAQNSYGLGLSIARNIVHYHKGSIWAESSPVSGNTFRVQFPDCE